MIKFMGNGTLRVAHRRSGRAGLCGRVKLLAETCAMLRERFTIHATMVYRCAKSSAWERDIRPDEFSSDMSSAQFRTSMSKTSDYRGTSRPSSYCTAKHRSQAHFTAYHLLITPTQVKRLVVVKNLIGALGTVSLSRSSVSSKRPSHSVVHPYYKNTWNRAQEPFEVVGLVVI